MGRLKVIQDMKGINQEQAGENGMHCINRRTLMNKTETTVIEQNDERKVLERKKRKTV